MAGLIKQIEPPKLVRCASMHFSAHEIEPARDGDIGADYIEPLSKAEYTVFVDWVRILSVQMRLAEFEVKVSPQSCEAGYVAEVVTDFNYHRINIALCPQFHTFSGAKKRSILVHELLHSHMSCVKMPFEALHEIVATDVYTITASTALRMEEHVVTSLEWALAPGMPLPPELGRPAKKLSEKVAKGKKRF